MSCLRTAQPHTTLSKWLMLTQIMKCTPITLALWEKIELWNSGVLEGVRHHFPVSQIFQQWSPRIHHYHLHKISMMVLIGHELRF